MSKDLKTCDAFPGTWYDVLVRYPPLRLVILPRDEATEERTPQLKMYCEHCDAVLWSECATRTPSHSVNTDCSVLSLTYRCKNCERELKLFTLLTTYGMQPDLHMRVMKLGEWPAFGPHVPARVISLIGPERETFLKGRRAEALGFGVGAFGYYRRVVESQRDRLLDAIIAAAEKTNVPEDKLAVLRGAKGQRRFSDSIEQMQDAIPDSLFIDRQNPLRLLHKALSEGLHEDDDDECLERAEAIREVLTALVARLAEVTKESDRLRVAFGKLQRRVAPDVVPAMETDEEVRPEASGPPDGGCEPEN
jgi:hypothetical protein